MMNTYEIKNIIIDSSDISVQSIMTRLCLLSQFEVGDKLDTEKLVIQKNSWWTTFYRTVCWENREKTIQFIAKLYSDAIEAIEKCYSSNASFHRSIGMLLLTKIQESKTGLNNIIATYDKDKNFIAKIQTQILFLDQKIIFITQPHDQINHDASPTTKTSQPSPTPKK